MRVFPDPADRRLPVQRLVGIVGGIGTIIVGLANWLNLGNGSELGVWASLVSPYTGMILLLGIVFVGCGLWDHSIARGVHILLFVFSGIFGALSANRGNITSAFFLVFAIILLAEYGLRPKAAWVIAILMLGAYLAALSIGYQDDADRPVLSAFASLITILIFVALFGGVILLHRTQLRRDAAELERRINARTAELNQALNERTVMLQEIHHRVKNNMQTISALISMEADKLPPGDARSALAASQQRIQAMAGVHDALYKSDRLDRVDLGDYTRGLVDVILSSAICPVDLELQTERAGSAELSFAASLGLILNELVSNALKHGFGPVAGGKLRVSVSSFADRVILEVEDDGPGLPDGFALTRDKRVGMDVVTAIVNHRGGTITFASHGGTTWHVELPFPARAETR